MKLKSLASLFAIGAVIGLLTYAKYDPARNVQVLTNMVTEHVDTLKNIYNLDMDGYSEIFTRPYYGTIEKNYGYLTYVAPDLSSLTYDKNSLAPRYDTFTVDRINKTGQVERTSYTVYFSRDPLSIYQWYIKNNGLDAFDVASFDKRGNLRYPRMGWKHSRDPGLDLNITEAWSQKATGRGIKVIVYDSGIDPHNPDLKNKLDLSQAVNFFGGKYETDHNYYVHNTHGTSVAGIIGAEADNGIGIKGIAYDAKLIPWICNNLWEDYLNFHFPTDAQIFQSSEGSGPGKIINTTPYPKSVLKANLNFFLSKGNYYQVYYYEHLPGSALTRQLYSGCIYYGSSCSETPKLSTIPLYYPILAAVSGINAIGEHLDRASTDLYALGANASVGSDVMFVGFNAMSKSDNLNKGSKGIFTTTVENSSKNTALIFLKKQVTRADQDVYKSYMDFYSQKDPDNKTGAFSGFFNGTSAATPMISGVAALVRSVNKNLTWMDVYDIMIKSASHDKLKKRPGIRDDANIWFEDGRKLQVERPTKENGAGFFHSNVYGFGLIDAGLAVAIAKQYKPSKLKTINAAFLKTTRIKSRDLLKFKAADNVEDATSEVVINNRNTERIYSVVIEIPSRFLKKYELEEGACDKSNRTEAGYYTNIYYNRKCRISDLTFTQLEVESPSGTVSIIKPMGSMILIIKNLDQPLRLESKAFYGEKMTGKWKIRAITSKGERWRTVPEDPQQVATRNFSALREDLSTYVTLDIYPLSGTPAGKKK
ncbi:MAG: S8 family serine peptidase [Succinivibrionaceae bacterium]